MSILHTKLGESAVVWYPLQKKKRRKTDHASNINSETLSNRGQWSIWLIRMLICWCIHSNILRLQGTPEMQSLKSLSIYLECLTNLLKFVYGTCSNDSVLRCLRHISRIKAKSLNTNSRQIIMHRQKCKHYSHLMYSIFAFNG